MKFVHYLLLLHLFELPEEKMDGWARLAFTASIILFGFSIVISLLLFNASNPVERFGLLAAFSYFSSGILSFFAVSLQSSDTRARLLWLATVLLLVGSLILSGVLLGMYTTPAR